MTAQTITEIKQVIDAIEPHISEFVVKDHAGSNFGEEQEYTAESLKFGLKEMLTEIRALVRAPAKFVRMLNLVERREMHNALVQMSNQLAAKDYNAVATTWDTLKRSVRPRGLNTTPELLETLKERIDALHGVGVPLEEKRDEAEQIRSQIETAKANAESAVARLDVATKALDALEGKVKQAEEIQQKAQISGAAIDQLQAQAQSKEELLSSFSASVQSGKSQLGEQAQKIEEYERRLTEYGEQQKEYLERAENLIKSARDALGYTTATGLSASFTERYLEEKKKWIWNFLWLFASAISVGGALWLGYDLLVDQSALTAGLAIARTAAASAAISAAWFCASQFVRNKNTSDDYGYKSVLAKSMVAFLDQFQDQGEREAYLRTVLGQIHQDPMRKKHDVDTHFSSFFDGFGKNRKRNDSEKARDHDDE